MAQTQQAADTFLAPLTRFYEQEQLPPLQFELLDAAELPEPQRHLLVHERDMTTRLERHHGSPVGLKALYVSQSPDSYFREVLLVAQETGHAVEYGAIEINLGVFPDALRHDVLQGSKPLGGLLLDHGFEFVSNPQSYFRVQSDPHIQQHLQLDAPAQLHGRANILSTPAGDTIANIVEILPGPRD